MQEWMTLTFLMGAAFIGGQVFEYAELVGHGVALDSDPYGRCSTWPRASTACTSSAV